MSSLYEEKSVALITIHAIKNFGSSLQTIATTSILKQFNCKTTVVNYIRDRDRDVNSLWYDKSIKSFLLYPYRNYIKFKFDNFLRKYCKLSKPIYSSDVFSEKCPKSDIYCTGSDQVWNIRHNAGIDYHYFWEGITGKKISFASSLGNSELTEEEKVIYPRLLSEYDAISVRENNAMRILSELGIISTQVLDPTLMLDRNEWKKYASKRLVKEPYIYVYLPYNTENIDVIYRSIRKLAKKKNLIVVTSKLSSFTSDRRADKTYCYCTPDDFISLMLNAEFVFTSSFHGTAFSINLNKQFWVYMPSKYSARISSILDLCGLQHRILYDEISDEQMLDEIQYNQVNCVLEKERKKSMEYLKNAVL